MLISLPNLLILTHFFVDKRAFFPLNFVENRAAYNPAYHEIIYTQLNLLFLNPYLEQLLISKPGLRFDLNILYYFIFKFNLSSYFKSGKS